MGCKNACICGGFCPGCAGYEKESYYGEAEDLYDELHGRTREDLEYEKAQEAAYYEEMERQERLAEMQKQNYDYERGDVKY